MSPQPDSPLRHRAFVQFWCARVASGFGFQMLSVAVGWQIYAITGRAFDLGLIGLVQFIPSVLLALPAGHVADQYERRRVVLIGQVVEWTAIVLLAVLTLTHRIHEAGILALVFAIGVAKAFESPSMQSLLPALVPPAILPRAVAVSGSAFQMAMILGPAVGGLLYVAGPGVVYLSAAALYLVAATMMALLPIFARDILHTGPWGLGLLRAAPAVGALLMSLWLAKHDLQRRVGMTMFASVAGFGVATLVFAVSSALWLSLAALFALGAFDMVSMVIRGSLVQLDTPDAMRGRVNAVNSIFINTSNQLGEFESGMLAAWLGAVGSAVVGGIGTLAVVGLWMAMFPSLRRRQQLHMEPTPDATEAAADTL